MKKEAEKLGRLKPVSPKNFFVE